MSVRRFIALLCLIAGSFGSGTVAALDCTITIGRSCQGVDSVFKIDAQFPLDYGGHLVVGNRGAAECRLNVVSGTDPSLGRVMTIPGHAALDFYNPGHYVLAPESQCDLSIRGEQALPATFGFVCPPAKRHYIEGQTVGDWKIRFKSSWAGTVHRWDDLRSQLGSEPETTEISCNQTRGYIVVSATMVIPGYFTCGRTDGWPDQGVCRRL